MRHATVQMRGNEAIGKFFAAVRKECEFEGKKIYAFAETVGMNGAALQRIEEGVRLPGPEVLRKLYPFILQAGMDPADLIMMWLEAHSLQQYVFAIRRKEKGTKP